MTLPKTAPWHYVDIAAQVRRHVRGDDWKHGCAVEKILEFKATLKNPNRSVEDRRFALRLLIHLVEGWATESILAARAAFLVAGMDARITSGQKLSREYYDAHLPVVRRRLNQAVVKLAMALNQTFPADRWVLS